MRPPDMPQAERFAHCTRARYVSGLGIIAIPQTALAASQSCKELQLQSCRSAGLVPCLLGGSDGFPWNTSDGRYCRFSLHCGHVTVIDWKGKSVICAGTSRAQPLHVTTNIFCPIMCPNMSTFYWNTEFRGRAPPCPRTLLTGAFHGTNQSH
jgi:hypothetical protein